MTRVKPEPDQGGGFLAWALHQIERLLAFFIRLFLVGQAFGAVVWLWMMPGGFPLLHSRSFANRLIPVLLLVVAACAIAAVWRKRFSVAGPLIVGLGGLWLGVAVWGIWLFPESWRLPFSVLLVVALCVLVFAWLLYGRRYKHYAALAMLVGIVFGAWTINLQQGPDPSTHPSNTPRQRPAVVDGTLRRSGGTLVTDHVSFYTRTGSVQVRDERCSVTIEPLLEFISVSPDRFWTIFAGQAMRSPERTLTHTVIEPLEAVAKYEQGGMREMVVVVDDPDKAAVAIDVSSHVVEPVYSHLNGYSVFHIQSSAPLFLRFSPCPEVDVEVKPFDYPVGTPARMAYLGGDGVFRVVEARTGEKGPFVELTSGRLARGEPLTVSLLNSGQVIGTITMHDWSAQVSTELSPTAGWGLPQNAIEFSSETGNPQGAWVFVTLAGTSVGRGWDSVGHTPGVYRNRVDVVLSDD